ncbi:MAG: hypothetical protein A2Y24_04395 [Clostridiales bacterium GWE2_32_10]|nr:MAG: hypothetical protein A2Y24_04395 [Clostridiales bacterium GWE2_32_10]HBY21329.1 hypothetical protein [Clostridiales bacterium]
MPAAGKTTLSGYMISNYQKLVHIVYPLLQTQGEKDAFIDGYAQDYEVCESKLNYYDILSKFTCI